MKSSILKYIVATIVVALFFACSVKKDRFINRNLHALSTEYNILYNGNLALDAGLEEVKATYQDNFWDVLTVERMPEKEENFLPGQAKNSNFERAEEKAVKAIQKHSMNIAGTERNPQIDEAYLLLGKARYFDNRFIPALESFNYILYKYPKSDKIYHAKIWREKVNIRIDNNEVAIKNLKQLLKSQNLEGQDLADANAMLAQAFYNIEVIDTAIAAIKIAKEETKLKEERARYTFILGQLYEKMNYQDSAFVAFQEVIDMKRKSPRRYVIQAHARQAAQFDYEKGDSIPFLEKYHKLIADRENRPYLDVLYHQMGLFYDNFEKDSIAESYYNLSNRKFTKDKYLSASNYRNIGEIYFENAEYKIAGKYYDSTLLRLDDKTREYRRLKKKRENLVDVIKYEDIAKLNDSILSVVAMNDNERKIYFEGYIEKLKKEDELKAKLAAEKAEKEANKNANSNPSSTKFNPNPNAVKMSPMMPPVGGNSQSTFYFYNPVTVNYGMKEFQKKWGNRKHEGNWRQSKAKEDVFGEDEFEEDIEEEAIDSVQINPAYTVDFYTDQLPKEEKVIDSITKERNNAYYELGLLYKEKFKEYELSANRFEKLLTFQPEERLVPPTKYYLYKVYEIIDPKKAAALKNDILTTYPDTRYAQIIQNPTEFLTDNENPEAVFKDIYKQLEEGKIREAYTKVNEKVDLYFGDEILPKMELLRAKVIARINGLEEYKKALNHVALTYANNDEGKQAQELLKDIPVLEKIQFSDQDDFSWKVIFPKKTAELKDIETLNNRIKKYIEDSHNTDLKLSQDLYDLNNDFVVLHGFKSKETATAVLDFLRENKKYKIKDKAHVISSNNYRVVQMKKQFQEWLKIE